MADDKWTMFKNYMHNELGITKDDIRVWVQEAVQREAQLMVKQTFSDFSVEKTIKHIIESNSYWGNLQLKEAVIKAVALELARNVMLVPKTNTSTGEVPCKP